MPLGLDLVAAEVAGVADYAEISESKICSCPFKLGIEMSLSLHNFIQMPVALVQLQVLYSLLRNRSLRLVTL